MLVHRATAYNHVLRIIHECLQCGGSYKKRIKTSFEHIFMSLLRDPYRVRPSWSCAFSYILCAWLHSSIDHSLKTLQILDQSLRTLQILRLLCTTCEAFLLDIWLWLVCVCGKILLRTYTVRKINYCWCLMGIWTLSLNLYQYFLFHDHHHEFNPSLVLDDIFSYCNDIINIILLFR